VNDNLHYYSSVLALELSPIHSSFIAVHANYVNPAVVEPTNGRPVDRFLLLRDCRNRSDSPRDVYAGYDVTIHGHQLQGSVDSNPEPGLFIGGKAAHFGPEFYTSMKFTANRIPENNRFFQRGRHDKMKPTDDTHRALEPTEIGELLKTHRREVRIDNTIDTRETENKVHCE
jgi:hypothetical protein